MALDTPTFPTASEDDWRRLAGAAASRNGIAEDEISVAPIYPRATDAQTLSTPRRAKIIQRITADASPAAVRQIAAAFAGGADGIEVVFDGSAHPLRSRLPLAAAKALAEEIGRSPARGLIVRIDAGAATAEVAHAFASASSEATRLVLGHDPALEFAARACAPSPRAAERPPIGDRLSAAIAIRRAETVGIADGRLWHAAGASDTLELAIVLATLAALLREASDPVSLLPRLAVTAAVDASLFLTIAKLRALRLVLARFCEAVGASDVALPIHSESAWRSTTHIEPRMNVLRGTIAALAAIAGGADSLTVLPFDGTSKPDADADRLARNTQLILAHEAHLSRVSDPAAGSGLIESLTQELAACAWRRFQDIEGQGGILGAIENGSIFQTLGNLRHTRREAVENGKVAVVGVNFHAARRVAMGGMIDPPPFAAFFERPSGTAFEWPGDAA